MRRKRGILFVLVAIALMVIPRPVSALGSLHWEPEINIDVLIVYDTYADDEFYDSDYSDMVYDAEQALNVFEGILPTLTFHLSESWVVFQEDDETTTDTGPYYANWLDDVGWPGTDEWMDPHTGTGEMTHLGMSGTNYSGIHGGRFDMAIFLGGPFDAQGISFTGHNALMVNLHGDIERGWNQQDGTVGTSAIICHETGHLFGLDDDHIDQWTDNIGNPPTLDAVSKDILAMYQHHHDEWFWYPSYSLIHNSYGKGTDPDSKYVNIDTIEAPYTSGTQPDIGCHVDTIGSSQYGYYFFGKASAPNAVQTNVMGQIEGFGVFKQNDIFPSYLRPGRRYMCLFVFDYNTGARLYTFKILEYEDGEDWAVRGFAIYGLSPHTYYRLGIGRGDGWSYDWKLEAECVFLMAV